MSDKTAQYGITLSQKKTRLLVKRIGSVRFATYRQFATPNIEETTMGFGPKHQTEFD